MAFDRRFTDLVGIELPIIQAPMAGAGGEELAIAVSAAGGLGSLPCGMLDPGEVRDSWLRIRKRTPLPINLNFFCHVELPADRATEDRWKQRLAPYYAELGIDPAALSTVKSRKPLDEAMCEVLAELKPEVVSFHFGLPARPLLERVRRSVGHILSSATTVEEARWLEAEGCDAVIAQGSEAGGHRGMFLTDDPAGQVGSLALIPQIADAVRVPVIAAGGIGDARGIVAAFVLGAAAVQLGTAYLRCPEARPSAVLHKALETAGSDRTVITNVITGRPARGIVNRVIRDLGPLDDGAPAFPRASEALAGLRTEAEARGLGDFSPLWCGQAALMCRDMPAAHLTRALAEEAAATMKQIGRD